MAYSKPNPIKQLQSQDQYKQDFEADLMEAGGETPLMQAAKSKKAIRKQKRIDNMTASEKKSMKKRVADGSKEFEGGSDVGNFLRRNSYNEKNKKLSQGDSLTNYLKQVQAKDDEKNFDPDFTKFGSKQTSTKEKEKETTPDINEEDKGGF